MSDWEDFTLHILCQKNACEPRDSLNDRDIPTGVGVSGGARRG